MENTQNTEETTTSHESETTAAKGRGGANMAIIAVAVIALLGGGYLYLSNSPESGIPQLSSLFKKDEVVARVNGEAISKSVYDESVASMRATLEAQGADFSNAELTAQMEKQVLDSLIDAELLHQAALEKNFGASEADVQTEYDALVTQLGGAEALQSQMASVGLTDTELRTDIGKQLSIRAYLTANIDTTALTVSEEETVAFYDGVALPADQKPTLEEVRAQIEAQLKAQKEQALIAEHVTTLRTAANIEVLI